MNWRFEPGTGRTRVVINPQLPAQEVLPIEGGLMVGSLAAIERLVVEWNPRYVVIHTSPSCLLDKHTGKLVDLWEEP